MPNQNEPPVILWLASWYPCRLDPYNGDFIQRAARALSLHLPVQVLYIMKDEKGTLTKGIRTETEQSGNLTETRIYYHPLQTGISFIDRSLSALMYTRIGRKWLRKFRMDPANQKPWIVETGVAMRAGTLSLWMKRKWGQPYLVQEHSTAYYRHLMPPSQQRGRLFWKMTHRILANADALLPDSRALGEWINRDFISIPFVEIPNVVETNHFFPNPSVNQEPESFCFIHVSTLGYQKNTDGLLRVFKRLSEKYPGRSFKLLIAGPHPEPHRQWVSEQGNLQERVIFTGAVSYREVADYMRASHALVLFSRFENLPCVMLEAFCCGLPVIATNVGGIAYHLGGHQGFLVESEDEEGLFSAMEQMLAAYHRFDRAAIASQAAARYGHAAIADLYMKTYRNIYPHLFPKNAPSVG